MTKRPKLYLIVCLALIALVPVVCSFIRPVLIWPVLLSPSIRLRK